MILRIIIVQQICVRYESKATEDNLTSTVSLPLDYCCKISPLTTMHTLDVCVCMMRFLVYLT